MFIGIYNCSTCLTYLNLISGVLGIQFLMINQENIIKSSICLLICGILDMLDGIVSRCKKNASLQEKQYGVQIDSLADMVSFGLLPLFIGGSLFKISYPEFKFNNQPVKIFLLIFITSLYTVAALIRLAYFNTMNKKINNLNKQLNQQIFIGIPVTISAIVFPSLILIRLLIKKIKSIDNNISEKTFCWFYFFMINLLTFLFIYDRIRLKKPKNIIYILFITIISVILIFSLLNL
ncbi:MAG: CDP-alcohol phosphatidyltransferase family protein [Vigna little leaf phytoplasma]|nr:CDP-alcohol phosphatidyltransferase family protein [Vigna little leaf phytoplasma]